MKRKLLSSKKPPKGFEKIEPELMDLQIRLREAETDSSDNKRKNEIAWPILKLYHQISRLVFESYKNQENNQRSL